MRARVVDRKFDRGEEISNQFDLKRAWRIGNDPKRVNVDFPAWMVHSLDREARRLGVTRQSLIKLWLADRLSPLSAKTAEGTR
ncbi:MAG TPA: CopG family transcriptional regulator [Candidatus Binatia bacterium]|nr:CopG family transcriptional regulator [Candidatus Binatia bacterium]